MIPTTMQQYFDTTMGDDDELVAVPVSRPRCPACSGLGLIWIEPPDGMAWYPPLAACEVCQGTGKTPAPK